MQRFDRGSDNHKIERQIRLFCVTNHGAYQLKPFDVRQRTHNRHLDSQWTLRLMRVELFNLRIEVRPYNAVRIRVIARCCFGGGM